MVRAFSRSLGLAVGEGAEGVKSSVQLLPKDAPLALVRPVFLDSHEQARRSGTIWSCKYVDEMNHTRCRACMRSTSRASNSNDSSNILPASQARLNISDVLKFYLPLRHR
jgi:hypothetical protein